MGCISSKLLATADDLDRRISTHHVVSLTSSTYGVLSLDRRDGEEQEKEVEESSVVVVAAASKATTNRTPMIPVALTPDKKKPTTTREAPPTEVINTWELMKDLTGNQTAIWSPAMKPAIKPAVAAATPTPRKRKVLQGKENNNNNNNSSVSRALSSSANSTPKEVVPSRVLRPFSSAANKKPSPLTIDVKKPSRIDREWGGGGAVSGSKRSLSPLFDPELVASFERELRREGREQIKKMVSPKVPGLLESFELKCPPGGENAVVLYTTTLRGIRKTFEDCNAARGAVESHRVRVVEKDISMDSGFREELRALMGRKEVRPPMVFVKGRLIGGAEEVLKLEEEGKLGLLFEGMPKNDENGCGVCGGMRFVMCRECNGSCKVLHEEEGSTVKCQHCNENGLIHCPNCTC
ncbi:uncharacterized protein M6B38_202575 [Iris pallida]|uniref:Glutaredoxin domain-containing protein n=1 Tax=Iris pallida TaxID=29817 RepID=A0AAX6EA59_IRIPA|nr:uncharacterized protein M6B38_202575 [Iris pallida]